MSGRQRSGFSLFETLVAMFVMLIGLLGIFSVFGSGMHARLMAQELLTSQDLATMWSDWIRFRLNDSRPTGSGPAYLNSSNLGVGKKGNFYDGTGDFHLGAGNPNELPTVGKNVYKGYTWSITKCTSNYKPKFIGPDGVSVLDWDQRSDGGNAVPSALGSAPDGLVEVELTIYRGARSYKFNYIFSGVGLKYER
jgi:Tfp pilus assembly protein PilV